MHLANGSINPQSSISLLEKYGLGTTSSANIHQSGLNLTRMSQDID